jgi:hypothetical protein
MSFGPCNQPLKIRKSIGIPIPKVGVHLGVQGFIPSHTLALSGAWMWLLGSLLAHTFVSPYFDHEPKAKVVTDYAMASFNVCLGVLICMKKLTHSNHPHFCIMHDI